MGERYKVAERELSAMPFVPEKWVGDHLQVGTLQQEPVGTRYERRQITYGVGAQFNQCVHTVERELLLADSQVCGHTNDLVWTVSRGNQPSAKTEATSHTEYNGASYTYDRTGHRPALTVPIENIENARTSAYAALIHLKPERHMNVTQAAMELKDTEQTLGQLVSFMRWARSVFGKSVRCGKGFTRLSVASKLTSVANAYLWYKFGVEPTVTDVKRFLKELSQGKLRVSGHKSKITLNRGTVVKQHYSVALPKEAIAQSMFPPVGTTQRGALHDEGVFQVRLVRNPWGPVTTSVTLPLHGSGQASRFLAYPTWVSDETRGCYFATLKDNLEIDGLDSLKNKWGWNCPALATLWELTPFSFLVDWVVDVGGALRLLERRYLQADYRSALGTIWHWERTRRSLYWPVQSCEGHGERVDDDTFRFEWSLDRSWRRVRETSSFVRRALGDAPGWVIPKLGETIRAYQISTGMALLMQFASSWRRL